MGRGFGRGNNTHISRGRGGRGGGQKNSNWKNEEEKAAIRKAEEELDVKFGFARVKEGDDRLGWLLNVQPATLADEETGAEYSAVDFYFLENDGATFKVSRAFMPYFLLTVKNPAHRMETETYLRRMYEKIAEVEHIDKEDLDLPNHLTGLKRSFMKLKFRSVTDLMAVRRELLPVVEKNRNRSKTVDVYEEMENESRQDLMAGIIDIREYDVPYYMRYLIDEDVRCSRWYEVSFDAGDITLKSRPDLLLAPEPRVLAFDIETTKSPLKFPDASHDQVMMISYMLDKQGYLITNRQIVLEDVEDFEYTPKPEYEGQFIVFNEEDEAAVLRRFFEHIQDVRPTIYCHFNGDFFDWPFIETRAKAHGMDMFLEIGVRRDQSEEAYLSRFAPNMDTFAWVKRDSYLPQGSQGLKAVTKAKLGYDPLELDPEDMTPFAATNPQELAAYSVSDAVCTYYLYMKYVHPFIFSLCTIIPMRPDQVLRKGSGTLCEALLMVEAFQANVVFPNKQQQQFNQLYKGHLLETETYVGGHVEACESGVFRSNLPTKFRLDPDAFDELIADLDKALEFTIVVENKLKVENITNYDQVKEQIKTALEALKATKNREEKPCIYHLDVAAMYPNIILSNRLQPTAMVSEETCASCDFNKPGKTCQRSMDWVWRGQYLPNTKAEFDQIRNQLMEEKHERNGRTVRFTDLKEEEQALKIKKRLAAYCRNVYKKTNVTQEEERSAIVCQRENSFYVDTVRAFRDRRYTYKGLLKQWKGKLSTAQEGGTLAEVDEASKLVVLYDSLQLAHKCILNSFYGYVMRRGARWFSMEMAGIVTDTGAKIIKMATQLIQRIGKPLELDTDGVWCVLPASFPENFEFKTDVAKKPKVKINYPCVVLNKMVVDNFTNPQYADLVDPANFKYEVHSECSIEFEVDGPYLAMILPASTEADRKLKKRYAVFEFDGTLAELKGFEIKRRGELQLIKIFQSQVFDAFLRGTTLVECYAEVAKVADKWLDVLYTKGVDLPDQELFDLISEARSMSKKLEEYEGQKSTSITTAKRLAEFLGAGMVKDAGLSCKYIISKKPHGAPVTERAVPVAIFSAEEAVKKAYLRRWCKDNSMVEFDLRSILDWDYYIVRLGTTIQKIVTIPAALQKVDNPVPRVAHPDWLYKRLREKDDTFQQKSITSMFQKAPKPVVVSPSTVLGDIENLSGVSRPSRGFAVVTKRKRIFGDGDGDGDDEAVPMEVAAAGGEQQAPPLAKDVYEDFEEWHVAQKVKWREMRDRRKRRREGHAEAAVPRNLTGVSKYLRQQSMAMRSTHWQIIQITPRDTPGEFTVWALIRDKMHPMRLTVPRVFYVNSRVEDTACVGRRVTRTLPRSRQPLFLYEYSMPETAYVDKQQELASFFSHPDVEGVYGNQVSLLFRAIVALGCVCSVKKGTKRSPSDGLMLDDLQYKTTAECAYLADVNIRKVFLYHSATSSADDARGVFAVFDSAGEAHVFFLNLPASLAYPNLDRIMENYRSRSGTETPPVKFTVNRVSTPRAAWRGIDRILARLSKSPTVILSMVTVSATALRRALPISAEFPVVPVPFHAEDNVYPPLGWENHAAQRVLQHYLNMGMWWTDFVNFSRYAHIPIGNYEADHPVFISDVFLARRLEEQQAVSWASNTFKPDLGGSERDDHKYVELVPPEIISPGAHHNICVRFELSSLAVNTVLNSSHINELEGAVEGFNVMPTMDMHVEGRMTKQGARLAVDETLATMPALKIIKMMVHDWGRDIGQNKNMYADLLQGHFHRWLQSPHAKLFDPALYRLVHDLMRKVFLQLIAAFKAVGAHIIFADFTQIIIATKKTSIENAYAYVTYLAKNVAAQDLFQFLDLNPTDFWESLLFLDSANYGGIKIELPADGESFSQAHSDKPNVISHWNIADYLPKPLMEAFIFFISEFIYKIHLFKQEEGKEMTSQDPRQYSAGTRLVEYAANLVGEHYTRNLLKIVQEVHHQNFEFPDVPGGHLDLTNPALEFIKYICEVFALDHDLETDVAVLKKSLLASIRVRAFDPHAVFRNPCQTYVLPNIICQYCNSCRNLDLCRDKNLINGEWKCTTCNDPYDKAMIERLLVRVVHHRSLAYQLQDLKCVKCNTVKAANIASWCDECSGKFKCTDLKEDLLSKMRTFLNIAEYYKFEWLQEEVEFFLERT